MTASMVRTRAILISLYPCGRWASACHLNADLLINRKTAPRTTPVSRDFSWTATWPTPHALREDGILQEIHATGGDVRRICDLSGLSITAALRYANTLGRPDLVSCHRDNSVAPDANH